jgi:hypothetical protein
VAPPNVYRSAVLAMSGLQCTMEANMVWCSNSLVGVNRGIRQCSHCTSTLDRNAEAKAPKIGCWHLQEIDICAGSGLSLDVLSMAALCSRERGQIVGVAQVE